MNRKTSPKTGIWEDILLILVLAKVAVDFLAGSESSMGTLALPMLMVSLALLVGLRSRFIGGMLRSLATAAAVGGWLFISLPAERPDLVPGFIVLTIAMMLAYAFTDLWRFGLRVSLWELVALSIVVLLLGSCAQLV